MKTAITTTIAVVILASNGLLSSASADVREDRIERSAKIESLYQLIRSGRLTRSETIEAQLNLARLEAEQRKDLRQEDRVRDKQAALKRRGI